MGQSDSYPAERKEAGMTNARSRAALLGFLDYCKDKGLLKAPTAEARKAAVNQVLGILSDSEAQDVGIISLDDVVTRFQNMHGKRYTPDSLRTYKTRVKNSIADFLSYIENPMEFRPRVTAIAKKSKQPKSDELEEQAQKDEATQPSRVRPTTPQPLSSSTLPIPIRAELTVLVHGIPFDLTEAEAKKIGNVIMALAASA